MPLDALPAPAACRSLLTAIAVIGRLIGRRSLVDNLSPVATVQAQAVDGDTYRTDINL